MIEFIDLFIEFTAVLIEFTVPFISITFVIQIEMQVFIMNAFLLIEFIRLFVEFTRLFSINALVLLKNSALVLSISGLALRNDRKITEPLDVISTSQLPQRYRCLVVGYRAILNSALLLPREEGVGGQGAKFTKVRCTYLTSRFQRSNY